MPEPDTGMTVQQTAEVLQMSTKTVRRYIADGLLEAQRLGPRAIRVSRDSVRNLGTPLQYIGGGAH